MVHVDTKISSFLRIFCDRILKSHLPEFFPVLSSQHGLSSAINHLTQADPSTQLLLPTWNSSPSAPPTCTSTASATSTDTQRKPILSPHIGSRANSARRALARVYRSLRSHALSPLLSVCHHHLAGHLLIFLDLVPFYREVDRGLTSARPFELRCRWRRGLIVPHIGPFPSARYRAERNPNDTTVVDESRSLGPGLLTVLRRPHHNRIAAHTSRKPRHSKRARSL